MKTSKLSTKTFFVFSLILIMTFSMLSLIVGGPQSKNLDLSAVASTAITMTVDGIKGTNQNSYAADSHEILSYTWATFSDIDRTSGSSQDSSSSKVIFTEISVLKNVDSASPNLFQACVVGTNFKELTITQWNQVGNNKAIPYIEFKLENAVCSLYAFSASDGEVPLEQLSLNFEKITMSVTEIKSDGTAGDKNEKGWDLKENKEP